MSQGTGTTNKYRAPRDSKELVEFWGCQRRHERHEMATRVQICWINEGCALEPVILGTADISASGAGLLSRSMVHVGQEGILLLASKEKAILRCFVVRHCRYSPNTKAHHIGIEWIPDYRDMPVTITQTEEEGYQLSVGREAPKKLF